LNSDPKAQLVLLLALRRGYPSVAEFWPTAR